MDLAVRARFAARLVAGLMLPFLNPAWDALWYEGMLVCLMLVGVAQRRVGRVGQSRAELARLAADLSLLTVALLAPNPFSSDEMRQARVCRFDLFQYFHVILAAGVLS